MLLGISHPGCWVGHVGAVCWVHSCLMDRSCSQWRWLSFLCFGYFEAEGLIPSGDICLFLLSEQSHFSLSISWLVFWSLASQRDRPRVSLVIHWVWMAPLPPPEWEVHHPGLHFTLRKKFRRPLFGLKLKNSLQKISFRGQNRPEPLSFCFLSFFFFPLRCFLYGKRRKC